MYKIELNHWNILKYLFMITKIFKIKISVNLIKNIMACTQTLLFYKFNILNQFRSLIITVME